MTHLTSTVAMTSTTRDPVPQYAPLTVLAVWAAAAVPMGLLAWVVVPAVAGPGSTRQHFIVTLLGALTTGLVWQFILVLGIVAREQRTLRWSALRGALWLQSPTDGAGRRGGRLWRWAVVATVAVAVLEEVVSVDRTGPAARSFHLILGSADGQALFRGNWGLFALAITSFVFNTVLGEGTAVPRTVAAADAWGVRPGRLDNQRRPVRPLPPAPTVSIPSAITTGLVQAYATKRWHSAWLGIIAHSAESVFFTVILFMVVVS
jgi:hypothetical protein